MPLSVPSYSIDDLERFPQDGNRYELLDGVLLVTPAPLPPHQVVISRIQAELMSYVQAPGRAHVVGPGAVEIAPKKTGGNSSRESGGNSSQLYPSYGWAPAGA